VPTRGEILRGPGEYDFEIIDADPRRVKRVRVFRRPPDPPKRERKRKPKPDTSAPLAPGDGDAQTTNPMDNTNSSG
jgi:hypothetical protein